MRDILFRDYVICLKIDYKIKLGILTHYIFDTYTRDQQTTAHGKYRYKERS